MSPTWDDELRELAEDFVRGADERLLALSTTLDALSATPADSDVLAALKRHFHRLRGAATTFGFAEIGEIAREGEWLCDGVLSAGDPPSRHPLERWQVLLAQLRRAFNDAAAGAPMWATTAANISVSAEPPASSSARQRPPSDVLVVDDDPVLASAFATFLGQQGMSVRGASSWVHARHELDARLPDALIVDVNLPDGAGYDVVRDVRGRLGGDEVAIVVVSKLSAFLDQAEAIQAGADAYFEKPLDWEALGRKLQHLLDRSQSERPRILVVEDDENHAAFVRTMLDGAGYEVEVCGAPRRFEEKLAGFRPDLIVMDIVMPQVNGHDLARYVRQRDQYATLPIVFLTGEEELDARIKTVRAGGDDHLVKPVHPALLVSSVAARLERARFFKTLLNRDGLTRLLTHTSFVEHAQALVSQRRRDPTQPATLVMIDLDQFKLINDTYGHQAGDRVLVAMSALLRRRLRHSDIVGRYGGEEFAILLDELDAANAVKLIERLLREFSGMDQRGPEDTAFSATFSAGIAAFEPSMDLERWIRAADRALYKAKRKGRNQVAVAGPVASTHSTTKTF